MSRHTALVLTPRLPWPLDDGGRVEGTTTSPESGKPSPEPPALAVEKNDAERVSPSSEEIATCVDT